MALLRYLKPSKGSLTTSVPLCEITEANLEVHMTFANSGAPYVSLYVYMCMVTQIHIQPILISNFV